MTWQWEVLPDVHDRYGEALWASVGTAAIVIGALAAYGWAAGRIDEWWRSIGRVGRGSVLGILAGAALAWVWHLRWISDDAFISFRYAQNLANGHGLVFNEGERVEGYTNFLWTVLFAGPIRMGADPVLVSLAAGLVSFLGALAAMVAISRRLAGGPTIPVAAILAAANYGFASYGTSGLETMFASAIAWWCVERAMAGRPIAAGILGAAAAMARPDHAIFTVAAGIALAWDPARRRDLIRFGGVLAAVYLPYFLWRWHYYGAALPNTYYAKSADGWYLPQGILYLHTWLVGAGVWAVVPLAAIGMAGSWRTIFGRICLIALPVYALYVAKVGGDFMWARFCIPLLPGILLLAEAGLRRIVVWAGTDSGRRSALACAAGLAAIVAVPTRILHPEEIRWHLSDCGTFYRPDSLRPFSIKTSGEFLHAMALKKHLRDRGVQATISSGSIGMIGYYGEQKMVDEMGLTEPEVARMPIVRRGRPGHERRAPVEYRLAHGAQLFVDPQRPQPFTALTAVWLGDRPFYLYRWDPALLARLAEDPEVGFVDFPAYASWRAARTASTTAAASWKAFAREFGGQIRDAPKKAPPPSALYWLVYARELVLAGDLPAARKAYVEVLRFEGKENPGRTSGERAERRVVDFGIVHTEIAQTDVGRRDGKEADAIASSGDSPGIRNNLGNEFFRRREFTGAIREYRRAIALHPEFADAFHNLGAAYLESGRAARACEAFGEALALDPGRPETLRVLELARRVAGLPGLPVGNR